MRLKQLASCAKLRLAVCVVVVATLAGCGGGGSNDSASTNYVTWTNSSNGTVVKDYANNSFAVDASTRNVISLGGSPVVLNGLTVDMFGQILNSGTAIGGITAATSTVGTTIAVSTCSNGSGLTIKLASAGWSYSCGSGNTSTSSNSAGNSGISTGNGSTTSSIGTTSYISWNGSANGSIIKDATNNNFAVVSSNSKVVYLGSNSILTGLTVDSSAQLLYNGSVIGTVSSVPSISGSTITQFVCNNGTGMDLIVLLTYTYSCGNGSSNTTTTSGSVTTGGSGSTGIGATTTTTGSSSGTVSYGALAVDYTNGGVWGWAVNYPSRSTADTAVINQCTSRGANCTIVLDFASNGNGACGAYAADQTSGSTIQGYAVAGSLTAAQSTAMSECSGRGGQTCRLRVWGCTQ